jgi:uncharacterized protein (UPF0332 family)
MKGSERDDLVKYRLQRANETLNEARINMEQELWRVGINRLYYAVFYAVTALLTTRDVSAKTHKGVRQQFGLLYMTTGLIPKDPGDCFSELFERRHSGDYDDFVNIHPDDVVRLQPKAEALVKLIERMIEGSA